MAILREGSHDIAYPLWQLTIGNSHHMTPVHGDLTPLQYPKYATWCDTVQLLVIKLKALKIKSAMSGVVIYLHINLKYTYLVYKIKTCNTIYIHLISHLGLREQRGLWAKRNNSQMGAGLFVVCFGGFFWEGGLGSW